MADVTKNFPADAGLMTGSSVSVDMPATAVRVAGSATITPFVYICDSGNNRIQVTDYDGNPLFEFGSYGTGDGEFDSPYGVAAIGDRVYVSDTGNHRVQYFDLLGNYLGQWGTYGTANGEFAYPKGIATNGSFVFVIDQANNRFQIFTMQGLHLFTLGEFGSGTDQFNAPTDCYVDSHFLWIDDTGNSRVVWYSLFLDFQIYGLAVLPALTMGTGAVIKSNCTRGHAELAPMRMLSTGASITTSRVSRGAAVLPALSMGTGAVIVTAHAIRGAAVLPALTTQAQMVTARAIVGAAVLPALTVSATVRRAAVITGAAVLPALRLASTMYTVRAAPAYYGQAVNLRNKALTKYTGFEFNSMAVLNGKAYGATSSGIHLLEGDDDNGTDIAALIRTGRFDLHDGQVRKIVDAWLSGRLTGQATLTVYETEDDDDDVSVYYVGGEDTAVHDERIPFAKGHEGRFVEFELANVEGADFDIAGLTIRTHDIPRTR